MESSKYDKKKDFYTYLLPPEQSCSMKPVIDALILSDHKKVIEVISNTKNFRHIVNNQIRDDKPGWTLLHDVCYNGIATLCQCLIENGANVDAQDLTGSTPLHDAVRNGKMKCIKILCENNACPLIKSNVGETPYDIAMTYTKDPKVKAEICNYLRKMSTNYTASSETIHFNSTSHLRSSIEANCTYIQQLESEVRRNKQEIAAKDRQMKEMRSESCKRFEALVEKLEDTSKIHVENIQALARDQAEQIRDLKSHMLAVGCDTVSRSPQTAGEAKVMVDRVQENFLLLQERLRAEEHMDFMFSKFHLNESDLSEIESQHGESKKVRVMVLKLLRNKHYNWVYDFRDSLIQNHHTKELVAEIWPGKT